MKVFNIIIEVLTSPFTFLFRTKTQRTISKAVKPIIVLAISIFIVAALLFLLYYKELLNL